MQVTKELLTKQLEQIKNGTDGFMQGYSQALGWVFQVIETKEPEKPVETPK